MLHRYIVFQTIELIARFAICDSLQNPYNPPTWGRDKIDESSTLRFICGVNLKSTIYNGMTPIAWQQTLAFMLVA